MNINIQMTKFKGTLWEIENTGRTFDYTFDQASLGFTKCILVSTLGDFPIKEGDYICNIGGGDFVLPPNIAKEFLRIKLMDESASICRNPTSVVDKITENMEKLYPEDVYATGHPECSITPGENLWEVYSAFKSYTAIQGGTVEFNKDGEIEKLIAHFKINNNG